MPNDERMTLTERYRYLERMARRYVAAVGDRRERSRLLDEMGAMTGLHRKSVQRRLRPSGLVRRVRARQRGRTYGHAVDDALRVVWESLDYVCAERLTPALVSTARLLARHGELRLTGALEAQLGHISRASVQRRLTRLAQDARRLPRRGTERANRANALLRRVPMTRIAWDEAEAGHFEVDLVHHSGHEAVGEYVHTLQLVDVATGWSERVAASVLLRAGIKDVANVLGGMTAWKLAGLPEETPGPGKGGIRQRPADAAGDAPRRGEDVEKRRPAPTYK